MSTPQHEAVPATSSTTLIVADDHPLFRAALREAIRRTLPSAQVVEADSADALDAAVAAHPAADLILLDLRMPGARGFSSLIALRAEHPAVPVAVVSAVEEPAVMRRAIDFGAAGFIPKSTGYAELAVALRAVLDGSVWLPPAAAGDAATASSDRRAGQRELAQRLASLTPQQFRVLMALAEGRLNKQIAADFGIAEATVKAHVTAILRKLGLYRRTQAALLALRLLQIDAEPIDLT